ncbi:MAG: SRPBCC family protein [Gemmobacter sp.]
MTDPGPFDLTFSRTLKAPRAAVWRCWTEPDLLMQWFCPRPWRVTRAVIDLRPGGNFVTDMAGPEGEVFADAGGLWMDVVPTERLVFTSALTAGWRPAPKTEHGFPMSVILTFRDTSEGGTQYDALVLHRDAAGHDMDVAMGFHEGWGKAAEQLDELALTL